ncbi:hypothetical protein FE257_008811 [Aspergillus nanangensis]|uniref:Hsp70 family protein n=1 Tax=Aspergillus nanangensis TaxID=2582783 RepID=A0AAD4CMD8_ASPNN|nr:hypothetical protein FE257_008811 [Aspergillus nanangensis]
MGDIATPQPVSFHRAQTDVPSEINSVHSRRFVVGLDFGTTFSSVSVACVQRTHDGKDVEVEPSDIWSVCNYPEAPSSWHDNRTDVPTEALYPRGAPHREPIVHLDMTYGEQSSSPREASENAPGGQRDSGMGNFNGDADFMEIDDPLGDYYWGYEVQKEIEISEMPQQNLQRITRFKLLLDNGQLTEQIRAELTPTVDRLQEKKVIGDNRETDIIADFLERLFQHTKDQLKARHGYMHGEPVEFALCIPVIWTRKACRKMHRAMTAALHRTEFITQRFYDVGDLFIVPEPEAASAYVLAHSMDIMAGESFVLLDAGGGTVDAITYKVASHLPLTLERQAVPPRGALCGSSYLNEAFKNKVEERLKGETYLQNMEVKINSIMEHFENQLKRNFDPAKKRYTERLMIDNLKANKEKDFTAHKMHISRKDMAGVFESCLTKIAQLMLDQITQAEAKDVFVKKVILIGGFAASPALVHHLSARLVEYSQIKNRNIQLRLPPNFPGTAVASGAVLRALRKQDGPASTVLSSFGALIAETYDKDSQAHVEQRQFRRYDPNDRSPYIKDTIFWFVNRGEILPSRWEWFLPVSLRFSLKEDFTFTQILYVSDRNHRSSYRVDHEENNGKEEAGRIIVDMTYLKTQGLIEPVKARGVKKPFYEVVFDLVVIITNHCNLKFEARYPSGSTAEESVQERGQICIAAAFLETEENGATVL